MNASVDRHVGLRRAAPLKLCTSFVLLAVEVGLVLADSLLAIVQEVLVFTTSAWPLLFHTSF